MLLKRIYSQGRATPQVTGIKVLHAGGRQRFSTRLVENACRDGWMELESERIILRTEPAFLMYRIVRTPGYYCCYCGESLPGIGEARVHVAAHIDAPSSWLRRLIAPGGPHPVPDPANPAGYRRDNFYECVLERKEETRSLLDRILRRRIPSHDPAPHSMTTGVS